MKKTKDQVFRASNRHYSTSVVLRGTTLLHRETDVIGLKFNTKGIDFSTDSSTLAQWTTHAPDNFPEGVDYRIYISPARFKIGCCRFSKVSWNKLIKAIKKANAVKK